MRVDLYNTLKIVRAISPDEGAADNTAKVSEIIDTKGFDGLLFAIATGVLADVDATFTVLVEDGDDAALADAAAVEDKYLHGTEAGASFTFAADNATKKIGYRGIKRYVRLTVTPANNTGVWDIGAVAILGAARDLVAQGVIA